MSQENLEGVADVLEEMVEMRESDPQGYEAMLQDLRSGDASEADLARQHGQAILDHISGGRDDPLHDLLKRAHAEAVAKDGEQ